MRVIISFGVVVCLLSAVAFADVGDNPLPDIGTVGGSNLRTNEAAVPYIFGDGSNMYVKARVDLASIGLRRPLSTLGITFDTDGSFFLNTITSSLGPAPYSGITKFNSDGTVAWTDKMPNGAASIAGGEVIVGSDYVYSQKLGSATGAIYALNKSTGATAWAADLTSQVNMAPVLSNGYLYGVESNGYAFAINASTGSIVYELDLSIYGITTQSYSRPIFIEDAFGEGNHGLFWKGPGATQAISVSSDTANYQWSQAYINGGYWDYNDLYDPATNQIYRRMGDAADAGVQGIDPATGAILWSWTGPNQGYEGVAIAPGGGLLISGQGSTIYRLDTTKTWIDPDTEKNPDGLVTLDPAECYVWTLTGQQGDWPTTNRTVMVTDPVTGAQVWITGTDGGGEYDHRLRAIDPTDGSTIWEFMDPDDPSPNYYNAGGSIWRQLSVSPNGDLVFLMFDAYGSGIYGVNGTLMIVSVASYGPGDANGDGVVDILDLDILARHWGEAGAGWAGGDFNNDNLVDILDLDILANAWGNGLGGVGAVPEPMTMSLLGLGGLALLRRRRK